MGRPRKDQGSELNTDLSAEEGFSTSTLSAIDNLIKELEKKHGKGTAMLMDEKVTGSLVIPRWEVDSPNISWVLGGGIPKGRIIEVYGPESAGKTSLACYLAGQVQKSSKFKDVVGFVDAEHAIDPEYAKSFGWDITKSVLSQPDYGEQALDVAEQMIKSGVIKFIVIDSVAALTPLAEMNGEMEDQQMGAQARMMGKGLRKLQPLCGEHGCTILFINQIRMKIGVMYGNPETTPGGRALPFYSSIRLEIRKVEDILMKDNAIGLLSRVKAVKNKTAVPKRKKLVKIVFGQGFAVEEEYVDFAIENNIIEKSGSWFMVEGERMQGKSNVVAFLKDNPGIYQSIIDRTKDLLKSGSVVESSSGINEDNASISVDDE